MPSAQASRDEMMAEWLRGNEAFKRLARRYGKAPAKPAPTDAAAEPHGARVEGAEPASRAPGKAPSR